MTFVLHEIRFCTIVVLVAASGVQPTRISVIFRAKTGEKLQDEKDEYDPDVDV